MMTDFHISQEILAIDVLEAIKSSLEHSHKHILRLLRLYGEQVSRPRPFNKGYPSGNCFDSAEIARKVA